MTSVTTVTLNRVLLSQYVTSVTTVTVNHVLSFVVFYVVGRDRADDVTRSCSVVLHKQHGTAEGNNNNNNNNNNNSGQSLSFQNETATTFSLILIFLEASSLVLSLLSFSLPDQSRLWSRASRESDKDTGNYSVCTVVMLWREIRICMKLVRYTRIHNIESICSQ